MSDNLEGYKITTTKEHKIGKSKGAAVEFIEYMAIYTPRKLFGQINITTF